MQQMSIQQALNLGKHHHLAGRLQDAEQIYRQILAVQPQQPDVLNLLGVIASQVGQHKEAERLMRQAIALNPNASSYHENLGVALLSDGLLEESLAASHDAVRLNPRCVNALNNIGLALHQLKRFDEASAAFRSVLELQPNYYEALINFGNTLQESGQAEKALECFQSAIKRDPQNPKAYNNCGNILQSLGRVDEAIAAYRKAIQLKPDYYEAHNNLGTIFDETGQLDEAIACYREALRLEPQFYACLNNLGNTCMKKCMIDEAITSYQAALNINPDSATAHSSLISLLYFSLNIDSRRIAEEHERWNARHSKPVKQFIKPHCNDPDPDRKLRIGYVAASFFDHPVGRFILPLLEGHDPGENEVYCYSNHTVKDTVASRLRAAADIWRDVSDMSHEQVAESIRKDQIDILVDLDMHTAENRLLVFARKPAPVQVTYLAYCSTTGLDTMDYRLTDRFIDPPGSENECILSERPILLPHCYWCYRPRKGTPEVVSLPALASGFVTFGCLNGFCKVNASVISLWGRLLNDVRDSRLVLHAEQGSHRQRVLKQLANEGVDASRIKFVAKVPPHEYFGLYDQIDIGLDPFPYGGGTTTCDALWMGVPVISLIGKTGVGRGGLSILSNIGLAELAAETKEQYVEIAATLASDLPRLAELRRTMRQRMQASQLMDEQGFARGVESAFRQMWREWCKSQKQ